ncbi:MAG: MBL fold metallo-hydrolase [Clostridia bacterium]
MQKLYPLFSGSTGNSYFLGDKESGILIDAGKNCKQITLALELCEIPVTAVKAIILTHEHVDHVGALRVFAKKNKIPAYCSFGTRNALVKSKVADGSFYIEVIENEIELAGMKIKTFPISHDCEHGVGFRITVNDKILAFATDLGFLSDEVKQGVLGSDFCVIESNHDVGMLQMGEYPYVLKKRILSQIGHLSNEDCSNFLPYMYENGTKNFLLAHLSAENNSPIIAFESAVCAMKIKGYEIDTDYKLYVANPRNSSGKGIELG